VLGGAPLCWTLAGAALLDAYIEYVRWLCRRSSPRNMGPPRDGSANRCSSPSRRFDQHFVTVERVSDGLGGEYEFMLERTASRSE
jgi:hypothetical protein